MQQVLNYLLQEEAINFDVYRHAYLQYRRLSTSNELELFAHSMHAIEQQEPNSANQFKHAL